MNEEAKENAIRKAMSEAQAAFSAHLASIIPKLVSEAFDAGAAEYAAALQRAMGTVGSPMPDFSKRHPMIGSFEASGTPGKDGRAPRGSVRMAVLKALWGQQSGLTTPEVMAAAEKLDPTISGISASNELNRKKGDLYINVDGRWQIKPGLTLGGKFYEIAHPKPTES